MSRAINLLFCSLLLSTSVVRGADEKPADKGPDPIAALLEKLQKSVDGIDAKLSDAEKRTDVKIQKALETTQTDIAAMKAEMKALRDKVEAMKPATVSNYGPNTEDLRKQLDRLETSLKAIREQMPVARVALSPATTGRVLLGNDYPVAMEFVVNDLGYTLRPYESRELRLPAGPFSLRIPAVPGYQVAQGRQLGTDKPYEIRVVPRP